MALSHYWEMSPAFFAASDAVPCTWYCALKLPNLRWEKNYSDGSEFTGPVEIEEISIQPTKLG